MGTSAIARREQRPEATGIGSEHEEPRTGEHYLPALAERALRARITDLQGRIDELEQTLVRERAGRGSAARDLERFCHQLGALAHELRNPLSSISGWLQLICSGKIEFETKRRALASMTRSLRTLTRMVEDFADYARCVEGSLSLQKALVSSSVLLGHALTECRPLATQRGVALACEADDPLPELRADPCRVRQIFELLISSALRATPRGGEIQVRASGDGQQLRVSVSESAFTRVSHPELGPLAPEDDGRNAPRPSLSLELARHLTELHDGCLVNLGHAFQLQLPAAGLVA